MPAMTIVHSTPIATIAAIGHLPHHVADIVLGQEIRRQERERDPKRDGERDHIGLDRQTLKQRACNDPHLARPRTRDPERGRRSCSDIGAPHRTGRPRPLRDPAGSSPVSCRVNGAKLALGNVEQTGEASDRPCWLSSPCRRRCRRSSAAERRARRRSRTRRRHSPSCRGPE